MWAWNGVEMRPLPTVTTLKQAVESVINSNKRDGYPPTRFIQATQDGVAPDLKTICERPIVRGETLEYLESALLRFPTLLTIEDFVARQGLAWGFSPEGVEAASARVTYFDQIAHGKRYS
jgi:hypothetical protein